MHRFSKPKIVNSVKYAKYADVLSVVLQDGKFYSHSDIEKAIKSFFNKNKKGKVK